MKEEENIFSVNKEIRRVKKCELRCKVEKLTFSGAELVLGKEKEKKRKEGVLREKMLFV